MNNTALAIKPEPELCSGFGQYHSDQGKKPRAYAGLNLSQIENLIYKPQCIDKSESQWVIFSTLKSRSQSEQAKHGSFYALWADIDENPVSIKTLADRVEQITNGALSFVYTSKSATEENQKARVIIPLSGFVAGAEFSIYQKILNDLLELQGITPDRRTEPVNQICYLPNQGGFYDAQISTNRAFFDPENWRNLVEDNKRQIEVKRQEREKRLETSKLKAKERLQAGTLSPIDAFNFAYSIELLFETYGYKKSGNRWLSPNSESGVAGVTITENGTKWHSQHGSDSGIGQNGFGDAFDLFTYYEHMNSRQAAIKAAGLMFEVDGMTLTKANQEQFKSNQIKPIEAQQAESENLFDLNIFALNGSSQQMQNQMLEDKYILGELALLGQSTAFYAKPNAGKTLLTIWLLIESIKSGGLNAEDIFYLNCDDNHKGLTYKLGLAEEWGFRMLAPGYPVHQPFKAEMLIPILGTLVRQQTASGKVLVLDTLKKFVDLMNKKSGSDFGKTIREFVSHGGSVILLAHVNKHRSEEGKVIFSGTSDIVDDIDCAYTMDIIQQDDLSKTVKFENFKNRGDVAQAASYQYSIQGDYTTLLSSIKEIDQNQEERLIKRNKINEMLEENAELICCAIEAISEGVTIKTDLVKEIVSRTGFSRRKTLNSLNQHAGTNFELGHRWRIKIEEKNTHTFELLPQSFIKGGG
tara:strand:+ start:15725 stop:17812 length:2088 start_codon:yes stop_codon:yes gene_type:complete